MTLNTGDEPLSAEEESNNVKKSANSRRRRRGSRRRSSGNSDNNDVIAGSASDTENHVQRRKSSTARPKQKTEQEKESSAFQSLVDIIHEMKRLPSISITTDKKPENSNSWKRVRRHSEPQHKIKQHQNLDSKKTLSTVNEQQHLKHADIAHGKPVFSNSFLALELEDEGENNIEPLVSPLNKQQQQQQRTRSKSGNSCIIFFLQCLC